jgi:hypothetical protein
MSSRCRRLLGNCGDCRPIAVIRITSTTNRAARSYVPDTGNGARCRCQNSQNNGEAIMSNKLALALGAAFILASPFLAATADAGVQYHGGPKSTSTASVSDDWNDGAWLAPGWRADQAPE